MFKLKSETEVKVDLPKKMSSFWKSGEQWMAIHEVCCVCIYYEVLERPVRRRRKSSLWLEDPHLRRFHLPRNALNQNPTTTGLPNTITFHCCLQSSREPPSFYPPAYLLPTWRQSFSKLRLRPLPSLALQDFVDPLATSPSEPTKISTLLFLLPP